MVSYASETLRELRNRRLEVWRILQAFLDNRQYDLPVVRALRAELQVLDKSITIVMNARASAADASPVQFAPTGVRERVSSGTAITGVNQVTYLPRQKPGPPHEPADPIFTEITGIDPPDTYDGWREAYVKTGLQSALDHMREHVR